MSFTPITAHIAHKWLNLDTYWESQTDEPPSLCPAGAKKDDLPSKHVIIQTRKEMRELEEVIPVTQKTTEKERKDIEEETKKCEEELRNWIDLRRRAEVSGRLNTQQQNLFDEKITECYTKKNGLGRRSRENARHQRENESRQSVLDMLKAKYKGDDLYDVKKPLTFPKKIGEYYPLLNRRSDLRDEGLETDLEKRTLMEQLVAQMKDDLERKDHGAARGKIAQLDKVCETINKPRQTAEAKIEVAIVLYEMLEYDHALEYLGQSLMSYRGADSHAEAITRWIIGRIQWENPATTHNAMVNWRKCYEMFASVKTEKRAEQVAILAAQWYQLRAKEMDLNLQNAIQHGYPVAPTIVNDRHTADTATAGDTASQASTAPTPPHNHGNGSTESSTSADNADILADELLNSAVLRFQSLPVYESIPADPAGGIVFEKSDGGFTIYAEADRLHINDQGFYLLGVRKEKVVALNHAYQHRLVRVIHNSMNRAAPHHINEGDYVLLRQNSDPDDGKIVAAVIIDRDTGKYLSALKRKRQDGLYSESTEKHDVVPVSNVGHYVGEVIAIAKPCAEK